MTWLLILIACHATQPDNCALAEDRTATSEQCIAELADDAARLPLDMRVSVTSCARVEVDAQTPWAPKPGRKPGR